MKKITPLYNKQNPYFTGDTFYQRYVSTQVLEDLKNNKPLALTGFTSAELELIERHGRAQLWEKKSLGDYTCNDNPNAHVGYLRQGHFVCLFCNDHYNSEPDAKVYLVNIAPYKQTCHDCNRLVVQGRTSAWCNAFD